MSCVHTVSPSVSHCVCHGMEERVAVLYEREEKWREYERVITKRSYESVNKCFGIWN